MDFSINFEHIGNGVRIEVRLADGTLIDSGLADNNQDVLDYVNEIVREHCVPLAQ